MKQDSSITRSMTAAQEKAAAIERLPIETAFHIYTEDFPNIAELVSRYFDGATIYSAVGLWQSQTERSVVIEVIGARQSLQRVLDLAADIRQTNAQHTVMVAWQPVSRFDVTADSINVAAL